MRRLAALLLILGIVLLPSAATAAVPPGAHVVSSKCSVDWYVNSDELALLPTQSEAGLVFDGPSLVHRLLATPVLLADAPLNGAFTADVQTGVAPLFKMETTSPYSTVNKTASGYWSSKISTGPGSQASPVVDLAALADLAPYDDDTLVYSFGVGYANDAGNKAVVSTITFGPNKFDLTCKPKPPSSPPASNPSPSSTAPVATADSLPLTGTPVRAIVLIGAALFILGGGLAWIGRRRRLN